MISAAKLLAASAIAQAFLVILPLRLAAQQLEPDAPPGPVMKSLDLVPPSWSQILDSTDGELDGCNSSRFQCVLANEEAVLDLETGLVWQRQPSASSTNWTAAQTSCPNATTGNRRGWRLPWLEEMQSLVDPSEASPALPAGHPFQGITVTNYWTSTTSISDATQTIAVVLATGAVTGTTKAGSNRFWCVRGGIPSIVNHN